MAHEGCSDYAVVVPQGLVWLLRGVTALPEEKLPIDFPETVTECPQFQFII